MIAQTCICAISIILTIAVLRVFYWWRRYPVWEDFSLRPQAGSVVWLICILALSLGYFPAKHGGRNLIGGISKLGVSAAVLRIAYMLPDQAASVVREEFFERGAMQSFLVRASSERRGIVLAAAFFALTHVVGFAHGGFCWLRIGLVFILGLLFGVAYQRTKSILVPVAMHLSWNLLARLALEAARLS